MNGRTGERRFNSDWRNPVVPVYVVVALRKVTTLASTPRIQWIEGNLVGVNLPIIYFEQLYRKAKLGCFRNDQKGGP